MWTTVDERQVHRAEQTHAKATPRQVERGEDRASEANASAAGRGREMVEERGARLLQLSRGSRQSRQSSQLSVRGTQALAACDSTSQSAEREYVGAPGAFCGPVAPRPKDSSSLSPFALRCQASAVRAVCGSSASTDPCGGRWATGVPTATIGEWMVASGKRQR